MVPHLRIARPSDNLAAVEAFYREGLGFDRICGFLNHDGFDGVMLGLPDASYHLEFTHAHGHTVGRAPSSDNLLVLYLPNRAQWDAAVMRLRQHGLRLFAERRAGELLRGARQDGFDEFGTARFFRHLGGDVANRAGRGNRLIRRQCGHSGRSGSDGG